MTTRQQLKNFPPDMPLTEFIERHYLPAATARRGRRLSAYHERQTRLLRDRLALYLHRAPVVGDLLGESIAPFSEWLTLGNPRRSGNVGNMRHIFESLCRFVGTLGYHGMRGREKRLLSEAPGTLWSICLTRYFKVSLRIRADDTRRQYKMAIADFRDFLDREPTAEDLTHDNVAGFMNLLTQRGVSSSTTNERRGRLVALWNWLAKKRETPDFPSIEKLTVPRRVPKAWTQEELERLFAFCRQEPGEIIPGVKACDFWLGLHATLFDTAERIGAIRACKWSMLTEETGKLEIPAEIRKGRSADMLYQLHVNTVATLLRMKVPGVDFIFPWPFGEGTFYNHYKRILRRAGLATDRKSKFHKMRKSVASHLQARGVDACAALGHSSPEVTWRSYIDPRIVSGSTAPCNVLFRPENEPPRLEYAGERQEQVSEEAWL